MSGRWGGGEVGVRGYSAGVVPFAEGALLGERKGVAGKVWDMVFWTYGFASPTPRQLTYSKQLTGIYFFIL